MHIGKGHSRASEASQERAEMAMVTGWVEDAASSDKDPSVHLPWRG